MHLFRKKIKTFWVASAFISNKNERKIDNVNVVAILKRFNFNNPDVYIMQKVLFAFKFNNQHSIRWEYFISVLKF